MEMASTAASLPSQNSATAAPATAAAAATADSHDEVNSAAPTAVASAIQERMDQFLRQQQQRQQEDEEMGQDFQRGSPSGMAQEASMTSGSNSADEDEREMGKTY